MKHVITYPGFAEGKSARGLYDEIAEVYSPQHTFHILPFYEELDNGSGDRVIHSIAEHRDILQEHMDTLDGEITILGKCGGSRVVSSLDAEHLARVDKVALFNPPWAVSRSRIENQFRGWRGSAEPDGSWVIPRDEDGTLRYVVTKEYMDGMVTMSQMDSYRRLARATQLYIVRALDDKVIPPIRAEKIEDAMPVIDIVGGDHHLTGPARAQVLHELGARGVLSLE